MLDLLLRERCRPDATVAERLGVLAGLGDSELNYYDSWVHLLLSAVKAVLESREMDGREKARRELILSVEGLAWGRFGRDEFLAAADRLRKAARLLPNEPARNALCRAVQLAQEIESRWPWNEQLGASKARFEEIHSFTGRPPASDKSKRWVFGKSGRRGIPARE